MAIMQRTFKSWRRPWWRWRALADRRDRISAPGMFDAVDWSVTDPSTSGDIVISIDALPWAGGADITDIEYDVDGDNDWTSLGAAVVDDYPLAGFADGVEIAIRLRAVNEHGASRPSAPQLVTPTA